MSPMIRQKKKGSSTWMTTTIEHGCEKEWEEIKCPICMEHPHNAILLRCSSYELGCRPYLCNTSSRHSNCLGKFCNASESSLSEQIGSKENLICPLCRGVVYDRTVIDPVRSYLNTKSRTCSSQDCDFTGNYSELGAHARFEHPLSRPMQIDSGRERDWDRIVQAQEFEDLVSTIEQQDNDEEVEVQIIVPESYLPALSSLLATLFYQTNLNDDQHMIVDELEWPVATTQLGVQRSDARRRLGRNSRIRNLNVRHDNNFSRRRVTSNTLSQRYTANSINNHDANRS